MSFGHNLQFLRKIRKEMTQTEPTEKQEQKDAGKVFLVSFSIEQA